MLLLQIDSLLEGFCQDAKISLDQAIAGINKMSQIPDLREVFQVGFLLNYSKFDLTNFCAIGHI
jgi:hypothetical protein